MTMSNSERLSQIVQTLDSLGLKELAVELDAIANDLYPHQDTLTWDDIGGVSRKTAMEKPRAAFAAKNRLEKAATKKRDNPAPSRDPEKFYGDDGAELPF